MGIPSGTVVKINEARCPNQHYYKEQSMGGYGVWTSARLDSYYGTGRVKWENGKTNSYSDKYMDVFKEMTWIGAINPKEMLSFDAKGITRTTKESIIQVMPRGENAQHSHELNDAIINKGWVVVYDENN